MSFALLAAEGGSLTDVNIPTLIWAWVSFGVTFFALKKVAWPMLAAKMEEREVRIAEGLKKAEEAEKRAQELMTKQEQILDEARKEAQKVIADSRAASENVKNDLLAAAQAEIEGQRERAKKEIGLERSKAVEELKRATVESSLKFADVFPQHEQAAIVLSAAAQDLYALEDYSAAATAGRALIERYPSADAGLRRAAWTVVAHSSVELGDYQAAEPAYSEVLKLTPADDPERQALVDNLAASIYKQAEQANGAQDYRAAAGHFLRISELAPTSSMSGGFVTRPPRSVRQFWPSGFASARCDAQPKGKIRPC